MAASLLVPKNGALAYGAFVMDYNAFTVEAAQVVENATPYGTNIETVNVGNGTPDFTFNYNGFMLAHTTATQPNLPGSSTIFTSGGVTSTATFDTGCTESFTGVCERFSISHARMRATVPASMRLKNAGEVVEAWATT